MLRAGAVGIVAVTFVAVGVVGVSAFRQRGAEAEGDSSAAAQLDTSAIATPPVPIIDSSSPLMQAPPTPDVQVEPAAPTTATAPTAPAPPAPFTPTILRGKTMLADSVVAIRSDSDIVVKFDRMTLRTRRPNKFEQLVRTTLESVYGAPAAEVIRKLPNGAIASQGDLINELPTRGISIPVDSAWVIRLFPETRMGKDGPIVIRYRVRLAPATS